MILIASGGGEIVGDTRDRRVEILSDHEHLNATWSRFGPGRDGADLHVHYHHADLFYVLDGEFTLRLGIEDEHVVARRGTLVLLPPRVVHGFRNASDGELRYLNLHAPGQRFADYLRGRRDGRELPFDQHEPPTDGGRPTTDAMITRRAAGGVHVDVEQIVVAEIAWSVEPTEPVAHEHVRSLYVLEGEVKVRADGRDVHAGAGAWVQVPPGVPHAVAADGRYLDIRTPGAARAT